MDYSAHGARVLFYKYQANGAINICPFVSEDSEKTRREFEALRRRVGSPKALASSPSLLSLLFKLCDSSSSHGATFFSFSSHSQSYCCCCCCCCCCCFSFSCLALEAMTMP
ncbi:hypothetical protein IHE45_03G027100 [Dioscorea alata]|uniref:Uncharacterized protein n=1 Tax=Dioscorea alata TaxID=55571 RepID=A0ACB7WJN9_DIOAL|nr:hypothetical protein IHE45_03G027100 [Dioscorea alata]